MQNGQKHSTYAWGQNFSLGVWGNTAIQDGINGLTDQRGAVLADPVDVIIGEPDGRMEIVTA